MIREWIAAAPSWLLIGLGVGAVATVIVAGAFLLGARLFPDRRARTRRAASASVDGSDRRRAAVGRYLDRLGEEYREGATVHGRRVAFYLPGRDVALTFDARTYFLLSERGTETVLLEHEMPIHHLGRRLPFEVSETPSSGRVTPVDTVGDAFAELGIDLTTDETAIRNAYRERVKEVHPDQGGTEEAFGQVQEAYATALDYTDHAGQQSTSTGRQGTATGRRER